MKFLQSITSAHGGRYKRGAGVLSTVSEEEADALRLHASPDVDTHQG